MVGVPSPGTQGQPRVVPWAPAQLGTGPSGLRGFDLQVSLPTVTAGGPARLGSRGTGSGPLLWASSERAPSPLTSRCPAQVSSLQMAAPPSAAWYSHQQPPSFLSVSRAWRPQDLLCKPGMLLPTLLPAPIPPIHAPSFPRPTQSPVGHPGPLPPHSTPLTPHE